MIHFETIVLVDVMDMFRGELKDEYILSEIETNLSENDCVLDNVADAIRNKYEKSGNGCVAEKIYEMNAEEFVKFVSFNRDDSEIDYEETMDCDTPNVVAIRLGCEFDDEKALRPYLASV